MILFILAVIGMTHIIVDSKIMEPVQTWIAPRCPFIGQIMECQQCAGFWCGVFLSPLIGLDPLNIFACGCAGSFLAQLGYWILDALEALAKDQDQ